MGREPWSIRVGLRASQSPRLAPEGHTEVAPPWCLRPAHRHIGVSSQHSLLHLSPGQLPRPPYVHTSCSALSHATVKGMV